MIPVLLAVLLNGCGAEPGPASPREGGSRSFDGNWVLASGRGPQGDLDTGAGEATLRIEGESFGGTAVCNSYGATAEISGTRVELFDIFATEMGCASRLMEAEARYLEALGGIDTIERDGEDLVLRGPDSELRFVVVPTTPDASLEGHAWKLETLLEGTGNSGTASSAAPAEIRFNDDGSLEGTTGCRSFTGRWTRSDDALRVTELTATGTCTRTEERQDDIVLSVLDGSPSFAIEGDSLTLIGDERGLGYRKASKTDG